MDVNEVFENLALSEELTSRLGFNEGYKVGQNRFLQGYHLGYHKASILGSQLGYYNGAMEYYSSNLMNNRLDIQHVKKLKEAINTFPKSNDDSIDILRTADDIKLKFTKLCSVAKTNALYPESEKLDF